MRHITLPRCPACGVKQHIIANQEKETWYCFACQASGTYIASLTILERGTSTQPAEPDLPDDNPAGSYAD